MLRILANKHLRPRIADFYITTSGGNAVAFSEGSNDFTAAETGAGLPVLTLKQPFARTGLVFGTTGGTSGSYVSQAAASTKAAFSLKINDSGGSATDTQAQGFVLGWDSTDTNLVKLQDVKGSERETRIWGARITSAGIVSFGSSDVSCNRSATGTYDLTFKRAFKQKPIVLVIAANVVTTAKAGRSNGQLFADGSSVTASHGRIFFYNAGTTLTNTDFHIIVVGNDIIDEHGGARAIVRNPQRKPRITAGQLVPSATPTFNIGTEDCTAVQNGTGDYTITFKTAFRQIPVCAATANNCRATIIAVTTSTLQLRLSDSGDSVTDPTSVDFLALGTEDPCEY